MKPFLFVFFSLFLTIFIHSPAVYPFDEEKNYQGTSYACTGVGDSKEDLKWKEYPLKLMFTAGNRAYVAEVEVVIVDGAGVVVLKATCDSPWLVAKLKPGRYSVTAQAEGARARTVKVSVPAAGQNELAIRFSEIPVEKNVTQ